MSREIPVDIPIYGDGPYTISGLKTVVGQNMNPLSKKMWYQETEKIATNQSPVITAHHPDLPAWMKFLGGLDPSWKSLEQADLEMSKIIPRVKLGPNFPDWEIPVGTYWIDYEAVTASTSKLPTASWIPTLRSRFPEGSILLLGNIGKLDSRLALWKFRNEIWDHELIKQVDAVVCPDFSSYLDDPYPHGAVGERMTQIFIEAGYNAGVEVIPIISWQERKALRRQADFLGSMYPAVKSVYIELLAREVDRGAWLFSRFEDLTEISHLPLRFIISGLDAGWAVREAREMFPNGNFNLVSIWPWMKTSFTPGTKAQKARSFRKFVKQFEDFHNGEHLPAPKPKPESMTILKWQKEAEIAAQLNEEADLDEKSSQENLDNNNQTI